MSPAVESSDPHRLTRELIERNSRFVPEAIRADYFREMLHMTVLPEHDELLKILIALHFLSIIIGEAPDRITSEREKLAELLSGTVHAIQAGQAASISYQKQLEERLANLPTTLAREINLNSIAESMKESLRQQFLSSGIPETAHALAVASKQINQATSDFQRTARQLAVSCSNAADEASQAIESVRLALSGTTDAARGGTPCNQWRTGHRFRSRRPRADSASGRPYPAGSLQTFRLRLCRHSSSQPGQVRRRRCHLR